MCLVPCWRCSAPWLALWITGISLNIVSFLGAIIGVGIVAKNGILMLDFVARLRAEGLSSLKTLWCAPDTGGCARC